MQLHLLVHINHSQIVTFVFNNLRAKVDGAKMMRMEVKPQACLPCHFQICRVNYYNNNTSRLVIRFMDSQRVKCYTLAVYMVVCIYVYIYG